MNARVRGAEAIAQQLVLLQVVAEQRARNLQEAGIASACWLRIVGAPTSKTAARYSGEKSSRNLRNMLTKTNVAAVGRPVRVDIGRCRAMA